MSKPVVKIRKLEDSADWLDQRLVRAYLNTKYWAESVRLDDSGSFFQIGQNNPPFEQQLDEHGFQTFTFITAWNPGSQLLDSWHNQWRNLQLEIELHPHCRLLRRGLGIGQEGDWPPEESFLALDISLNKSVELAREFGQNAIVCWEKGGLPELWWI